ncbi:MAG: ferritin family protein [Candidatus Altiarchaeota archaeon]
MKSKMSGLCEGFSTALSIELSGRKFYLECAKRTANKDGKAMFNFLASEERLHYDKINELYQKENDTGRCDYVGISCKEPGVFGGNIPGVTLNDKSDALDALNVGVKAEERSIELYGRLAGEAPNEKLRKFFEKLVGEERRHLMILETEVEFVMDTGEFHDFKTVTM